MADEINPITGQEYYAGNVEDVKDFLKVFHIKSSAGRGRLETVTELSDETVHRYMQRVEQMIDSYLSELYFVPIRPYKQVMPDGNTAEIFPGRLRRISQMWAATLIVQAEFENLEPNVNEIAVTFLEQVRRELYSLTLFTQRIPGAVYRSNWSKTLSPNMQPPLPIPESF